MRTKTINSLLLIALCAIALPSLAQKASIKAVVVDTATKQKLHYAVVALFNKKDSLLVTSSRSFQDGSFLLEELKAGNYHLMVTYPKMADFLIDLELKDTGTTDIGRIIMTSREHLLQEVTVNAKVAAIRMKGDTLEYKADSFAVAAGANVEELLKRLPGIEVGKDGSIKAQGEKVNQVLVDGDEFFSDDPTLATKYLNAASVDKIQVFDKKSDQATFTGVDDGTKSKTINIKLKDNSKQGYFGKLSAGTDANSFYNGEAMFNRFKKKQKISVFGIQSNTGKVGLSYQDRSQYLASDNERIEDDGSLLFGNNNYESERYYGSGLPTSTYAGAQFSDKWNDNRHKINSNYRFNQLATNGWRTSRSSTLIDSILRENSSRSTSNSLNKDHKMAATYDVDLDSFASVKVYVQGVQSESQGSNSSYSETLNGNTGKFFNKSTQIELRNGDNKQFNGSILWRQRFRKAGRTISINIQHSNNESRTQKQTEAVNILYKPATNTDTTETPNQLQNNKGNTTGYAAKFAYTESLSKTINLEASYAIKLTNTTRDRMVYDKNTSGKYEKFIDSFSSSYNYKVISHMPGLTLRYNYKKYNITAGGRLSFTDLNQQGVAASATSRSFVNFFPQTNIRINLKQTRSISIGYNGRTRQPSINQLQPLKDRSNSLSEYIGNPDLKPSFTHSFSLNFNDYNIVSRTNMYGSVSFNFRQNDIASSQEYDQFNKTKYKNINIDGNRDWYGYFGYDMNIKQNLRIGISVNASNDVSSDVINNVVIKNTNSNIGIGPNISYDKQDKYSVGIRSSFNYSNSNSSNGNIARKLFTHNHNLNAKVYLPWKFELSTDANMDFQPYNEAFGSSLQVIKWNAALVKKLTKDGKTEARLAVFDILNQNTGYSRYTSGNSISESSSNYIPRYALLSLTWNFTHMHK